MNKAKIQSLKARLDAAVKLYDAEKTRLVAAGFKSNERYEMLKPLKESVDAANFEYVPFAINEVKKELNKIIREAN